MDLKYWFFSPKPTWVALQKKGLFYSIWRGSNKKILQDSDFIQKLICSIPTLCVHAWKRWRFFLGSNYVSKLICWLKWFGSRCRGPCTEILTYPVYNIFSSLDHLELLIVRNASHIVNIQKWWKNYNGIFGSIIALYIELIYLYYLIFHQIYKALSI